MGYCFMSIEKIKTKAQMRGKYGHNYRIYDVQNADPSLSWRNHEITDNTSKDYCQYFKEALTENNIEHCRKNAVLGLEILMTLPKEDETKVNIKEWEKSNKEWLEKTFNVNPDHNNVKSMVFHGDENGSIHIHAFVVPIDEHGHLNASRFIDGKVKMRELQNTYGQIMKERHNLDRGLEGSKAKHQDIKRYYTTLNKTIKKELPLPMDKENVTEYHKRANEQYVDMNLKNMAEKNKLEQKINEIRTREENKRRILAAENQHLKHTINRTKNILKTDLDNEKDLERIYDAAKQFTKIKESIKSHPDKEKAKKLENDINEFVHYNEIKKKKKSKQNKNEHELEK